MTQTAASAPSIDDLVLQLTHEVTFRRDEPYPELRQALEHLICEIRGLECAKQPIDWAQIVGEALNLRPRHGD